MKILFSTSILAKSPCTQCEFIPEIYFLIETGVSAQGRQSVSKRKITSELCVEMSEAIGIVIADMSLLRLPVSQPAPTLSGLSAGRFRYVTTQI